MNNQDSYEKYFALRSWWVILLHKYFSMKLLQFVINKHNITPNQLTFISIFFRFLTFISFIHISKFSLIAGGIFYFIAYGFDCIDGTLARLTGKTSNLGRYLDHVSDLVGDILILIALASSLNMLFTPMVLGMILMHLAESYISYIAGFAIEKNTGQSQFFIFKIINSYRNWWFKRNYKSFLSFPDYTAFVFILMPILNLPEKGLEIGFYLLLIIICYTIFSTFVSIHTGEKRFP